MDLSGYGIVLLFFIGGLIFITVTLFVGKALRPSRPNNEKLATYESGEESVGNAWGTFNLRFYVIALIFLLFEVELVFLFPWAIVFADKEIISETGGLWGVFAMVEAFVFIFILAVGLVYVWKNEMLDWEKPKVKVSNYRSPVPSEIYKEFNRKHQ